MPLSSALADVPASGSATTIVNAPPPYGSSITVAPSPRRIGTESPSRYIRSAVTRDPSARVNGTRSVRAGSKRSVQLALK
jgi:hypothetical protein